MICPKCKNVGKLNTVLDKDFYFCETCREEIFLEEKKTSKFDVDVDIQKLMEELDSDDLDHDDPFWHILDPDSWT